jgi:uncharacterized protein with LGFP repeats
VADQNWKEAYKKQLAQKSVKSGRSSKADSNYWRRIIIKAWVAITSIQIVLWLVIGVFNKHFTEPWWLWTAASGGIVAVVVWYILVKIRRAGTESKQ